MLRERRTQCFKPRDIETRNMRATFEGHVDDEHFAQVFDSFAKPLGFPLGFELTNLFLHGRTQLITFGKRVDSECFAHSLGFELANLFLYFRLEPHEQPPHHWIAGWPCSRRKRACSASE